jgi:HSP20 family protein
VRRERRESLPARWDPLRELEDMRERLDHLFEQLLGGAPLAGGVWLPPVDLEETDDAWVVEADLPGVKKGDVNIEVRDYELAIHGDVKERERSGILRRRTRRTGQFDYRVTLPGEVDADGVDAQLDHGVLTVRVSKPERAKPLRGIKGEGPVPAGFHLDLRRVHLEGARLNDFDLRDAWLCASRLDHADLTRARLEGADLSSASLDHADLTAARLFRANLCSASLRETTLAGVDLRGTNLKGVDLRSVRDLSAEQLRVAVVDAATQIPEG